MNRSRSSKWLAPALFLSIILAVALFPSISGYRGGVEDGDWDYRQCDNCHASDGSGVLMMEATTLTPEPGDLLEVTVNVTESLLTDDRKVGVFLLRDLADEGDPALDGWTILSDPHGGQHSYVEEALPETGIGFAFTWTLQAPSAKGLYKLHALVDHGGDGALTEIHTAGLEFNVSISPLPRFIGHNLPEQALVGDPIPINATLKDDIEVVEAIIFFQESGQDEFQSVAMELVSGNGTLGEWEGTIPAQERTGTLLFDIVVTDRDNYVTCHPTKHIVTIKTGGVPLIGHQRLATAYVNHDLVITASVKNYHDSFTISYRQAGDATFTTKPMERLDGDELWGNYTASLGSREQPGLLEYYLSATNASLTESTKVFKLEILAYWDLLPVDLQVSEAPHLKGEVILSATIRNNGSVDVDHLQVMFLDDNYEDMQAKYIGWRSNLTIPAGESRVVTVWWTPQETDIHSIRVVVDSDNALVELNETNNALERSWLVGDEVIEEESMGFGPALPSLALLMGVLGYACRGKFGFRPARSSPRDRSGQGRS